MKAYYQLSGEEVLREVNGSEEPLTKEQVSENQKKYGPNELTEGKKKTTVQIFLEQYKDFLVIILIIAAIASGFMGDIESAAVIVIVITMNAILGTVQTVKAEASLASLKKLSGPEAKVLRDGVVVPIPSAEVTVGDIIMLEAGDNICSIPSVSGEDRILQAMIAAFFLLTPLIILILRKLFMREMFEFWLYVFSLVICLGCGWWLFWGRFIFCY